MVGWSAHLCQKSIQTARDLCFLSPEVLFENKRTRQNWLNQVHNGGNEQANSGSSGNGSVKGKTTGSLFV